MGVRLIWGYNSQRRSAYITTDARGSPGGREEEIITPQKRLYRSTQDRMFAGVCGGIGEYLDVDPTLVRLVFVALTLLSSGSGLVIYVILMLIVPERPADKRKLKGRHDAAEWPEQGRTDDVAPDAPEDQPRLTERASRRASHSQQIGAPLAGASGSPEVARRATTFAAECPAGIPRAGDRLVTGRSPYEGNERQKGNEGTDQSNAAG